MTIMRRAAVTAVCFTLGAAVVAAPGWAAAEPSNGSRPDVVNSADDARPGQTVAKDAEGRTLVYVEGADENRLRDAVAKAGGVVADSDGGRVKAAVPGDRLDVVAAEPGVTEVRLPDRAVAMAGPVTSEGVGLSGAQGWIADGKRGAGVKVGVIDVGFGDLVETQTAGELPSGTRLEINNTNCVDASEKTAHGTAVAEIVHDMAPDADLYLACIEDTVSFSAAEEWLRGKGVHVITAAVGFLSPTGGRGDGTGPAGSPADVVKRSREAGILWSVAAGNQARLHFAGKPVDANGDSWVEFSGSTQNNGFPVQPGVSATVGVRWDAWPRTTQDLDLYVMSGSQPPTGPNDPNIVARSTRAQKDTAGGLSPNEEVTFTNPNVVTYTYYAFVKNNNAQFTTPFELFVTGSSGQLQTFTEAGSVTEPATSPHVIAVGATAAGSGVIESSSGRGPTVDGRLKPDLTGPDKVATSSWHQPMAGTSAAAAHVAGAAALLKAANPAMDAAQIQAALQGRTSPKTHDTTWGHGVLNLGPHSDVPAFPGAGFTVNQSQQRIHSQWYAAGQVVTLPFPNVPGDTTAVAITISARSAADNVVEVSPGDPAAHAGRTTAVRLRGDDRFTALTMFAPLGDDRAIRIRSRDAGAWVVVEALGHFSPAESTDLFTAAQTPRRVLDTRGFTSSPRSTPLKKDDVQELPIRGQVGVPTNATSVVVNVTGFEATGVSYLSLHGDNPTGITTVALSQADRRSNISVVPIGGDGKIRIANHSDGARTGAAVDVVGWFVPGSGSRYVTLPTSTRIADTVTGQGVPVGPVGAGQSANVQVKGIGGISSQAVAAALTVTSTGNSADTELTVSPSERGWSPVTNTGSRKLESIAGLALAPLGAGGKVDVRNERGQAEVSVDASGYFVGGQAYAPPASNCVTAVDGPGFTGVFDGRHESELSGWRIAGTTKVQRDGCELVTTTGTDVTWYAARTYNNDYTLKLDWKATSANSDSGVFVLFPAPVTSSGTTTVGATGKGVEVNIGPTGATDTLKTGGIVAWQAPSTTAPVKPVGEWNTFELVVHWNTVTVLLNGTQVNQFTVPDGVYARNSYFGLQNSGGNDPVRFRNVRVKRDTPVTSGQFRAGGMCLDLTNGDPGLGAVALHSCHTGFAQVVTTNGDGSVLLGGRCLAAEGSGTADGTRVVLQGCAGNDSEQWVVRQDGRIVNTLSGRCLTPTSIALNAPLVLQTCATSLSTQVWQIPAERGRVGKVTGPPGQCLDVSGNNPLENKVVQFGCNGSVAQSWVAIGGALRGAGKCLDVSGGVTAAGTPVILYECNGSAAQQWQARPDGTLVNPVSGRCLTSASTASGAALSIENCGAARDRQVWRMTAETVMRGALIGHVDKCLDVVGNDPSRNDLWLWTCYGPGGQLWWNTGDGAYRAFGKCLDIGNVAALTPVLLSTCNGNESQQWVARHDGRVVNLLANRCLSVRDANTGDGATVQINDCNTHVAQRWTIPVKAS
ncbi:subtilase family protein [Saccharothrix saharensis]|uniref:Subtilase family protein n=1 Tax=Saccharothrix saharensis TaxID=571190 RepID=A0A543JBM5_9PSEU|nr:subtilase family protein [Saccharothrix saharensis]